MINASDHPVLTDRESHLFATYLSLRFDLFKLAESERLSPQELLSFTLSPAVRAHLHAFRTFAEESFQARAVQLRASALDILHEVAQSTPDPIEKRRAASTLIRGLSPVVRTSGTHSKSLSSPQPSKHSDSLHPAPRFHVAQRVTKQANSASIPPGNGDMTPEEEAIYQANPPAVTPSPELLQTQVVAIATDCLADALNPHKASTAFAFVAPTAKLGGHATPKYLIDFANILLYTLAPRGRSTKHSTTQITDSPTESTWKIELTNNSGYRNYYILRLNREPNAPWLITNLNRQDSG